MVKRVLFVWNRGFCQTTSFGLDARPLLQSIGMPEGQVAEIKVPAEDPKNKKKEEDEKDKAGSSKLNGDKKDEEEELVSRTYASWVSHSE